MMQGDLLLFRLRSTSSKSSKNGTFGNKIISSIDISDFSKDEELLPLNLNLSFLQKFIISPVLSIYNLGVTLMFLYSQKAQFLLNFKWRYDR